MPVSFVVDAFAAADINTFTAVLYLLEVGGELIRPRETR